jgi:hypothetical protein
MILEKLRMWVKVSVFYTERMSTTYQITVYNDAHITKIMAFLKANPDISCMAISYPSYSYTTHYSYIPNYEFIGLCGSENLTKDGYISEAGAVGVILNYAKHNNLYFENYIELNEYMRDVLKTEDKSILIQAIPNHLKGLFKIVD